MILEDFRYAPNRDSWTKPRLNAPIESAVESEINLPNRYGYSRFFSKAHDGLSTNVSLRAVHSMLLESDSTCIFFPDHQIVRRISESVLTRKRDRLLDLARSMIGSAPFYRAKIDFYSSVLEQHLKGHEHKPLIEAVLRSLEHNPMDIASRLVGLKPMRKPEQANIRQIITRDPRNVFENEYTNDLCHLIQLIRLRRDPSLSMIERFERYMEWQQTYIPNPGTTVIAIILFADRPPDLIWRGLKEHKNPKDGELLKNQLMDMQYIHRYMDYAQVCESSRVVPVVISDDAALINILNCVTCSAQEGSGEAQVRYLLERFFSKNLRRAIDSYDSLLSSANSNKVLRTSDSWPVKSANIFDSTLDWWEEHTGLPFQMPPMG